MAARVDSRGMDEVLRRAVDGGAVPNVVATAADADGPFYEGAAGGRTAGTDQPLDGGTLFRIASMTKMVATVAALQLAERGELDLQAPVDTLVPSWSELQVLEGWDGDTPRTRPPATRATVHHLITHTSGLTYWFWNADMVRWESTTGTPNVLSGRRTCLSAPLVADPGTRFEYGINTDWLGLVVEAVCGRTLDKYLEENVLAPLGMTHTTFSPTPEQRADLVPVHVRDQDGHWVATDLDWAEEAEWWAGGHGLYSTPRDYLRFQRMLLGDGELDGVRILRPESVEAAFTNQIGDLEFPSRIASADPSVTHPWNGPAGQKWGYGLLLTTEQQPGMRAVGSGAWAGVFNTHFWVDRASGVTGAIYTQFLPFIPEEAMAVYADFERAVYASR
ncbi:MULTISPECIES: serine hydrolase domain-containing protein [unclassified Geodermatophilus]